VNKVLVIGIIVAAAILLSIAYTVLNNNESLLSKDDKPVETEQPTNTTSRHFTVELEESVGVSENP